MANKKNKRLKKAKKQVKHFLIGNNLSGGLIGSIVAALIIEWWEHRSDSKKSLKNVKLPAL